MKFSLVVLAALVAVGFASHCTDCESADFKGFGTEPSSKCGCCPWPCCCKCFEMEGSGEVTECRALLDLAFVLDSSGSIGATDWFVAKQFVVDVTSSLTAIGTDQMVAMASYSNNATLDWNLNAEETSTAEKLGEAISGLEAKGKFTNTVEGMEVAVELIFGSDADNADRPNVAVIVTDGRSNFRINEIAEMSARLQAEATVIAVGVTTEIDTEELNTISGDPARVFAVDNFEALTTIIAQLQKEICPEIPKVEKCFCCCTPEQFFGGGGAYYYH